MVEVAKEDLAFARTVFQNAGQKISDAIEYGDEPENAIFAIHRDGADAGGYAMTCTTHHNACDCREAHFATIALEREHWFSLANQRALDLAAERERVRGLEGALRHYVDTCPDSDCYDGCANCLPARKALGEG